MYMNYKYYYYDFYTKFMSQYIIKNQVNNNTGRQI